MNGAFYKIILICTCSFCYLFLLWNVRELIYITYSVEFMDISLNPKTQHNAIKIKNKIGVKHPCGFSYKYSTLGPIFTDFFLECIYKHLVKHCSFEFFPQFKLVIF